MRIVWLAGFCLLPACGGVGDFESHCRYATGDDGKVEFCGYEAGSDSVGDHQLGMQIGANDDVAVFPTSGSGGVDVAKVASEDPFVSVYYSGVDNGFTMVASGLGDTKVVLYDASGAEIDRVSVHVAGCQQHVGELGHAAFCGDADGSGVLATPASSHADISVFTRSYGPLAIHAAGSSASATVTASVVVPGTCDPGLEDCAPGTAGNCDSRYQYCTNVVRLSGVATGTAEVGVFDAQGALIDQIAIDVIDHW